MLLQSCCESYVRSWTMFMGADQPLSSSIDYTIGHNAAFSLSEKSTEEKQTIMMQGPECNKRYYYAAPLA